MDAPTSPETKSATAEAIAGRTRPLVPPEDATIAEGIARRLFSAVSTDDLERAGLSVPEGAAASLSVFARTRPAGTALVRAFDPDPEHDGFGSPHSIIEIVNDDMPFLVDSVVAELGRQGLAIHLLLHPVLMVARDGDGRLTAVDDRAARTRESMMHVAVDRQADAARLQAIADGLQAVLADVRIAVADWAPTVARARAAAARLASGIPGVPGTVSRSEAQFLAWLSDEHFTYLGCRRYTYDQVGEDVVYHQLPGSGLGVLTDPAFGVFDAVRSGSPLPAEQRAFLDRPEAILITKSDRISAVHRRVPMDVVIVKTFGPDGKVSGEERFVGLFTASVYSGSVRTIPLIADKVDAVIARAGYDPASHAGKTLIHVLETFPRDEIFQRSEDNLLETTLGIVALQDRPRTALFIHADPFDRLLSALVFSPAVAFSSTVRLRMADLLERAYGAKVANFSTLLSDESPLVRLLITLRRIPPMQPLPDHEEVERQLTEIARTWSGRLRDAFVRRFGEAEGLTRARRFADTFPGSYQEAIAPEEAVADAASAEAAFSGGRIKVDLRRTGSGSVWSLRVFRPGTPLPLSDLIPLLENLGFRILREQGPFPLTLGGTGDGGTVWLHDFAMSGSMEVADLGRIGPVLEEAVDRLWAGTMENDGFNRLILSAGLVSAEVILLRAYARFMRQTRAPFSVEYMEQVLSAHPAIAADLVALFRTRFDPDLADASRADGEAAIVARIEAALDGVSSLDEDRILRRFLNAVQSTLRTNYFSTGAGPDAATLAFKFDSRALSDLPAPRPLVEIFVYSPRVEGTHLRFGKVARGGIRWSDRREDFRTEILGLVKAQQVKNAVIVPVGSKGGFVLKKPPTSGGRDALQAEGIACYKLFIRSLLDLTDNLVAGALVPPVRVVRHDADDPYLVVAADKGTATFSDIANGLSQDAGFWLDDAFASGGSAGYDHKKMGITARGAWECVKRHFRERDLDIQTQPFTAVGVGDMSGDVFGNGMLLSEATKLVAAFDHRHIFIDPTPDPAISHAERRRLFDLPRSSWADYNAALISAGGGVYARDLKSIPLSAEARALLGIEEAKPTPQTVMRAILSAQVDLLWFGGIGTYIKAADETNADAGDKANDPIRIDGGQVRARVVGEGANLGVTQRGRIEAARNGVGINTDALDNSAGVDTSDHEVNIKILLADAIDRGALARADRDALLASMTDDVAAHVLQDNYQQSQAISLAQKTAVEDLDAAADLMRDLEKAGLLQRDVEYLPGRDGIARRRAAGEGLTRPELCVLLAYSKNALFDALIASDLPDDPHIADEIDRYFPPVLVERYPESLKAHRLRREIITTGVVNTLVNRAGATFLTRVSGRTGASEADIARAYLAASAIFELPALWARIEALDLIAPASAQLDMLGRTRRLIERAAIWLVRSLPQPIDVVATVARFQPGAAAFRAARVAGSPGVPVPGVPDDLAAAVAALDDLAFALDLVPLSEKTGRAVADLAALHGEIGARAGVDRLRAAAASLPRPDRWAAGAADAIGEDFGRIQAALAGEIAQSGLGVEDWLATRVTARDRLDRSLGELAAQSGASLSALVVVGHDLRALAIAS
ncbi:NAD-glutamate dehydrogenase [Segnochrobactraceae bacterium EtOH-i3]